MKNILDLHGGQTLTSHNQKNKYLRLDDTEPYLLMVRRFVCSFNFIPIMSYAVEIE